MTPNEIWEKIQAEKLDPELFRRHLGEDAEAFAQLMDLECEMYLYGYEKSKEMLG